VVEHPGLFLGQHNHPPRAVGKPFKHGALLTAAPSLRDRYWVRQSVPATLAATGACSLLNRCPNY
jgi:hypothetical protein